MLWKSAGIFLPILLGFAACATITKGTTQAVVVNTPGADGAVCELKSEKIGLVTVTTPGSVTLKRSGQPIQVHCSKPCFQDGVGVIDSKLETNVAGNIILGGVIGAGIDAATGAASKYDPEVSVVMTSLPNCRRS